MSAHQRLALPTPKPAAFARLGALVFALALVLGPLACGGRSLPSATDGGASDSASRPDRGGSDLLTAPDACVAPPGGCYSGQDCPTGHACRGCFADPCCPMCAVCYGRCEVGCLDSAECGPQAYCRIEGACQVTGAKMGECKPRPVGAVCLEPVYAPVCGCDGKEYACADAAAQAGVNVGPNPLACLSCAELSKLYRQALDEGKACFPGAQGPQCDKLVEDGLYCSCPTFISSKPDVVARLSAILKVSADKACGANVDCAAMPCAQPMKGQCTSIGGIDGRCTDG